MTGVVLTQRLDLSYSQHRSPNHSGRGGDERLSGGRGAWPPVTGILIVFEMTNEFYLVPALMLGALISSAVSKRLLKDNFYEAILEISTRAGDPST